MKKNLLMILIGLLAMTSWASAETIKFKWDQELAPDLAGWYLYEAIGSEGTFSKVSDIKYTGGTVHTSDYVLTVLGGQEIMYCWKLTAYDLNGNESDFSNSVCKSFDTVAPGVPQSFEIQVETPADQ